MKTKLVALVASLLLAFGSAGTAVAHSGGTDDQGCHENHDTGVYHCH
jgi:hypothetical protein